MKIEFSHQKAFLINVNARSEIHGDERQPAGDLTFNISVPNDILAGFHPTLKSALYFHDTARPTDLADQGMEERPGYLPHKRFPAIAPIKWNEEMGGVTFTIHGLTRNDIVLENTKVNRFEITALDGGTVDLEFRVQCHPDEKQFGRLCGGMIQTEVEISLASNQDEAAP